MAIIQSKRFDKLLSQGLAVISAYLVLLSSAPSCVLAQELETSVVNERIFRSVDEDKPTENKQPVQFTLEPLIESEKDSISQKASPQESKTSLLSPEKSAELFRGMALLPAITSQDEKLILPQDSIVKPKLSNEIAESFPPQLNSPKQPTKPTSEILRVTAPEYSRKIEAKPLEVSRISHSGAIDELAQLTISFSQPLVELGQKNQEQEVDPSLFVSITPQPKGSWQWAGTQTLIFKPDGGRFPKATVYTVSVPATARSIDGHSMAKAENYTLSFPAPKVIDFFPQPGASSQSLIPFIVARFNQNIDQDAAFARAHIFVGSHEYKIKCIAEAEYKKRIEAIDLTKKNSSKLLRNSNSRLFNGYQGMLPKSTNQDWIAFEPVSELPKSAKVKVVFDSGIASTEGTLKSAHEEKFQFSTYGALKLQTKSTAAKEFPQGYGKLYSNPPRRAEFNFNNKIDTGKFDKSLISILPPVEDLEIELIDEQLALTGTFNPGTDYRVVFSKSIADVFGQKLSYDRISKLTVAAAKVSDTTETPCQVEAKFATFAPDEPILHSIWASGKQRSRLLIYKVQAEDWAIFNRDSRANHITVGTLIATREYAAAPSANTRSVDLKPYMSGKYGHLLVRQESVNGKGKVSGGQNCWIQVTDLSLDTFNDGKLQVLTSRLSDGKQLEGVELSLLGTGVKARSDASGKATMAIPETDLIWVGLVGKKDSDSCILTVINTTKFGLRPSGLNSYAVSDRNLYKPGEKVTILGILRQENHTASEAVDLSYPSLKKMHWQLHHHHSLAQEGDFIVDANGAFSFAFLLPEKFPLGSAYVTITPPLESRLPQRNYFADVQLKIEEYRRPEFETILSSSKGSSIFTGEETTLISQNKYLAGGVLQNADNEWVVVALPRTFSPPNWPQYKFNNYDHRLGNYGEIFQEPAKKSLIVKTNSRGEGITKVVCTTDKNCLPISLACHSSVTDVNRQNWSRMLNLLVHPASIYVGIEAFNFKPGKKVNWKIVATDLDGNIVAGTKIDLACCVSNEKGITSTTNRKITMGSEPASEQFETDADSTIASLTASIKDSSGRVNKSFKLATALFEPESKPALSSFGNRTLEITTDKKTYKAGETAKVTIKYLDAPATGFFIVSKANSSSSVPFHMDSPEKTIELPITENHYPQIGMTALLASNRDKFATGTCYIEVPPLKKSLTLKVNPSNAISAPGKEITLAIDLKDQELPAKNGFVSIAVVDEAIIALANYKWQNPLKHFYKRDFSSLDMRRSRSQEPGLWMMVGNSRITAGRLGESGGPDDREDKLTTDFSMKLRNDFRPLAFCQSAIKTDAKGKAEVKFKLPDSVTRYRILAFAAAEADKFGLAESTITTNLSLMVKPSPPRFLNYGDSCQLPVVIQNKTDKALTTEIALRSNAAQIVEPGMQVVVPANDRVEVRFNVKANIYGEARFQCVAKADQLSDSAEFSLPVMAAASSETFATYGTIDKGAIVQKLSLPASVFENLGGLTVSTSSSAMQTLSASYEYLRHYPYDCSEQISSRLIAMLSLQDALQAFGVLKEDKIGYFKRRIEEDIALLEKRQTTDGAFSLWQANEKQKWPYVSAQVSQALILAKAKLYQVDERVLKQALAHLKEIEKDLPPDCSSSAKWALQAKALHVRHLAHIDDANGAKELLHKIVGEKIVSLQIDKLKQSLPLEVAAWLLPIFKKDKADSAEAEFLRKYINGAIRESASTASANDNGYGEWNYSLFYSPRRLDAVVTEALIEDQPDNQLIPKLVKGLLAERRNGIWQGTQENCCVLQTLDKYFSTYEKQAPDFNGQIWLNDTLMADNRFAGRTLETKTTTVPMQYLLSQAKPNPEKLTQDVLINKDGSGRLYYRLALDYASKNLDLKKIDQGFTVIRTYEPVDKKSDVIKDKNGTWRIKAGSTIKVKIRFNTPGIRYHVALNDPYPAGAEALNDKLQGTRTEFPTESEADSAPSTTWSLYWYDHQNLRDHQAESFSSVLGSGDYEFTYLLRATTPGHFTVPPTRVEEMYTPETFGRANSDIVVID